MRSKNIEPVCHKPTLQKPEGLIFPLAIVGPLGWGSVIETFRDEMY